jgi:hypothetical protein
MGSYHSRQIAEFNYFTNKYSTTRHPIFSRYINDGFMLTNNNTNPLNIITKLISYYPKQIPIPSHLINILSTISILPFHSTIVHSYTIKYMTNPNQQFLNLYRTQFLNTSRQANIIRRTELFSTIIGDIFYPLKQWPMKMELKLWSKPMSDSDSYFFL